MQKRALVIQFPSFLVVAWQLYWIVILLQKLAWTLYVILLSLLLSLLDSFSIQNLFDVLVRNPF